MSINELDSLMMQADIANKEARGKPRAVDGIWTPWAQVLCFRCHGANGPITSDVIETNSSLRTGEPETEEDYGEVLCHCDQCETPIWIRSDAGKLRVVAEVINKYSDDVEANMWQTGGMCPGLGVRRKNRGEHVFVSAMDGPFWINLFPNEQAYEDFEPTREEVFPWDANPGAVATMVRGMLGVEDFALAVKIATEFSNIIRGWLSGEEVAEVIKRNRNEQWPDTCHTHDFCDANEAMSDAFDAVGEDPIPDDETPERERCDRLWGLAWDLAKANQFNL